MFDFILSVGVDLFKSVRVFAINIIIKDCRQANLHFLHTRMTYMKRERAIAMNNLGQCLEYSHRKVSKIIHSHFNIFSYLLYSKDNFKFLLFCFPQVTSIYDIDKGDHLCTPRPLYFHHFIVAANYVKEGRRPKNGKQLRLLSSMVHKCVQKPEL